MKETRKKHSPAFKAKVGALRVSYGSHFLGYKSDPVEPGDIS